jgi:hypothetical protein
MNMNDLTARLTDVIQKRPWPTVAVVFLIAFLLGWLGMGWGLWPVEYVDGTFSQLRSDLQQEYVRLVASAYALDQNLDAAERRIAALGPDAAQIVADTVTSSTGNDSIRVTQLQFVLEASGALEPDAGPAPAPSLLSRLILPFLVCGGVVVVGLIGVVLYLRLSAGASRARTSAPRSAAAVSARLSAEAARTDYSAPGAMTPTGAPPVARFMTTYTLGDDVYDDSFSIDGPDGSFLGECGMGISETIGVGDPKKVTAFEVWLFDKNDIRTVTKVMMSEHAFRDEALKSRLAAKGEPVQAASGDTISLETATLVVTARVVDMAYGGGALPPHSFFERLTIELAAFKKPEAG